jgi:hypothetical protein
VDDRSSSRNGIALTDEMVITNVVDELMADVCLKLRVDMNENHEAMETPLRSTSGASLSNLQVL